jgi:hypothetical protein
MFANEKRQGVGSLNHKRVNKGTVFIVSVNSKRREQHHPAQ